MYFQLLKDSNFYFKIYKKLFVNTIIENKIEVFEGITFLKKIL